MGRPRGVGSVTMEAEGAKLGEEASGTTFLGPVPTVPRDQVQGPRQVLARVYSLLAEGGYNPLDQLVGYLLSGDPAYITNYGDARSIIRLVGRDELLEELVRTFLAEDGS